MSVAVGFISRSCSAPTRWCVSALYGVTMTRWSTARSRSGSVIHVAPSDASTSGARWLRLWYATFMSKPPWPRLAMAWPMRPMPSTPSVAPCTSPPANMSKPQCDQRPSRRKRSLSEIRRAVAIINAKPKSAVVSVSTPGALVTTTPRAVQAGTSMLL